MKAQLESSLDSHSCAAQLGVITTEGTGGLRWHTNQATHVSIMGEGRPLAADAIVSVEYITAAHQIHSTGYIEAPILKRAFPSPLPGGQHWCHLDVSVSAESKFSPRSRVTFMVSENVDGFHLSGEVVDRVLVYSISGPPWGCVRTSV